MTLEEKTSNFAKFMCEKMGITKNIKALIEDILINIELYDDEWINIKSTKKKFIGVSHIYRNDEFADWIEMSLSDSEKDCITSCLSKKNMIEVLGSIQNRQGIVITLNVGLAKVSSVDKIDLQIKIVMPSYLKKEFNISGKFENQLTSEEINKIQSYFTLRHG